MTTEKQKTTSSREGWAIPCLLIFGSIILAGFLATERPFGGTLLAMIVIGGAIALLAKRDWQNKVFGPLSINDQVKRYVVLGVTILFMFVSLIDEETVQTKEDTTSDQAILAKLRLTSFSDDAQDIDESFFHASARDFIIMNIEPNKLNVGGSEFRVKRNPVGEGCFVYDPRTRFNGAERPMVWWVRKEGEGYTLNSPSKMVTPGLKWTRDAPIKAPLTHDVVGYVFHDKPMSQPAPSSKPELPPYTVREYKIYHTMISAPSSVSEEQAMQNTAEKYSVPVEEVKKVIKKVQSILFSNKWYGSPEGEIQRASDWKNEKP